MVRHTRGREDRAWWRAVREVFRYEWLLLQSHRKQAIAGVGLLFLPALYALSYLLSMWDTASHTRALPAGLVNLDTGASYRDRDLNLGADVLATIEAHGMFAYVRFDDAAEARRLVQLGELAFVLEVPALPPGQWPEPPASRPDRYPQSCPLGFAPHRRRTQPVDWGPA